MADVTVLLKLLSKETEEISEKTQGILKQSINLLFESIDYVNPHGLSEYGLKDNLEAKELVMSALNDYIHDVSGPDKLKKYIEDLLREKGSRNEKGGLLSLLSVFTKTKELNEYCAGLALKPSEFSKEELRELNRIVKYLKIRVKPGGFFKDIFRISQKSTMWRLITDVKIDNLLKIVTQLTMALYEEDETKVVAEKN